MISSLFKHNILRLPLLMVIAGLLILVLEKFSGLASDRLLMIGVAVTMIGYMLMVGRVFSEATWLQSRYSNSRCLFYLLLFTVFLFSFSQGIFSEFGSLFYFAVAAASILRAATMFAGFQNDHTAGGTVV